MVKKITTVTLFLFVLASSITLGISAVRASDLANELKVGGFFIGPQAYSFNRYSLYEAIDKAKEVGSNVIEAYPGQRLSPDDDTQFNHNASPSVWAKAKMKAESAGIRIVNYGVVGWKDDAELARIFDFAKIMNIPAVTMEPKPATTETFDKLEKLVKKYNIKVGVHNHPKRPDNPGYRYWDPQFVLSMVKNRDSRLGAAVDTGHHIRSGIVPLDAVKLLEGHIVSMHLKDLNVFDRKAHDVPYGQGVANVKDILDELKRQQFNGNMSIEYEYNWESSVPEIKQCVDFVREYGKVNP